METIRRRQASKAGQPKFARNQRVGFIGGTGHISNLWAESGTWVYGVETSQSQIDRSQARGRSYSKKTTVFLHESDLWRVSTEVRRREA